MLNAFVNLYILCCRPPCWHVILYTCDLSQLFTSVNFHKPWRAQFLYVLNKWYSCNWHITCKFQSYRGYCDSYEDGLVSAVQGSNCHLLQETCKTNTCSWDAAS